MGDSLQFAHLLGTRYEKDGRTPGEGLDCTGVCLLVNSMLGREIPDEAFDGDEEATKGWEYLGCDYQDATEQGDVIASCASSVDGTQLVADHVSVVTSPKAMLAMTASKVAGVFQTKTFYINHILGVYRWVG